MATHQRLTPWIEELILSYGTENRRPVGDNGFLMGHIINVSSMPPSQTQGSEYINGLIFLSDGVLQIPALLTLSTWERLQYEGDQETFNSLLNAVVCLRDFKLRFHAPTDKRKSRFYLAIVDLWMMTSCYFGTDVSSSVYPSSVYNKINQTWMNLHNQDITLEVELENHNLTLLLNEWERDTVAELLDNVRRKLTVNLLRHRPQPSTSSKTPHLPSATTATGWEYDRTCFKNEKLFCVPVKSLLMPEEGAAQLPSVSDQEVDRRTNIAKVSPQKLGANSKERTPASRHVSPPASCHGSPPPSHHATTPPSCPASHSASHHASPPASHPASRPASLHISPLAVVPISPENAEEVTSPVSESRQPIFSNPWDMFPSPRTTSTCTTPASSLGDHQSVDASKPKIRLCPYRPSHMSSMTDNSSLSTQSVCLPLPSTTSTKTQSRAVPEQKNSQLFVQNTSFSASLLEGSRDESLPPFQRPRQEITGHTLSPASPELLISHFTAAADLEVAPERRAPKRKKSQAEERQSWDLEKPSSSGMQNESIKETQGKTGRTSAIPRGQVHPCGAPFSYTYKTTTQNIKDFGNLKVEKPLLYWAIRYLLSEGEG